MAALTAAGHPSPAVSNTRPVRRIGYLLTWCGGALPSSLLVRLDVLRRGIIRSLVMAQPVPDSALTFFGHRKIRCLLGIPITKRISWSD
ncbi:MAG: hypothetical protein ACOH1P_05160 [Lysobacter sp.]